MSTEAAALPGGAPVELRSDRATWASPSPSSSRAGDPLGAGGSIGRVALVGAGPGDPELLTLKAARLLGEADVVLLDALVDPRVLVHCRPGVRILDVGKTPGGPYTPQEETLRLLEEEALLGQRVVRLKGGDPFVFGRGGEEALYLAERGIPCEVVPGISSALAVPALQGIPVTHRGLSTHFTVLTGTTQRSAGGEGRDDLERSWMAAARAGGTLVFLMAMHCLERVEARLLEAGLSPGTPAAVVQSGSREGERVLETTLGALATSARAGGYSSPAIVVVGEVVAVRARLLAAEVSHVSV